MGQAAVVLLSALCKPGGLGDQADCASFGQRSECEAEKTRTRNPCLASATLLLASKTARRRCQWSPPVTVLPAKSDSLVVRQEVRMSCFRGHRWSRHSPRPSIPDLVAPRGCALSSLGASSRFEVRSKPQNAARPHKPRRRLRWVKGVHRVLRWAEALALAVPRPPELAD